MTENTKASAESARPVDGALSQVVVAGSDTPTVAVWWGGQLRRPPSELDGLSMIELLDDWTASQQALGGADAELPILDSPRVVAPLTYPGAVVCAGANYVDHFEEMGIPRPDSAPPPFFFLKPPRTTVIGDDQPIPMPAGADVRLDWEGELAVVISRKGRDLTPAQVGDHIAGYTIANDISARGAFRRANPLGPPFAFDWLGHKCQDGSCPLGPAVVPAHLVGDPQDLWIRTYVNDELMQDSSTRHMYVAITDLVAALSQTMTLSPGDVVLTGTPAGVGSPRSRFLSVGDRITVSIEGLGTLKNHIEVADA